MKLEEVLEMVNIKRLNKDGRYLLFLEEGVDLGSDEAWFKRFKGISVDILFVPDPQNVKLVEVKSEE